MALIFLLLQQLSVYLVIAYLLSKTPIFMPLTTLSAHSYQRLACYFVFSLFCILGTYFGLAIDSAIANTRAIGAVIGGLLGGPLVGFAVGLTGGIHRYSMGGFTDLSCAISTTAEGLLGGLMHRYYMRRGQIDNIFNPYVALCLLVVAEIMQMSIILLIAKPFSHALDLVRSIALPMIIANAAGAALFMSIIADRKTIYEKYSAAFSSKALTIAERSVGVLSQGFNAQSSQKIAQIIYEETGVGAVSITDREKILAFIGIAADHHLPGTLISSDYTKQAIKKGEIIYADGYQLPYQCSLDKNCRLGSSLVIPLMGAEQKVLGTIKLYEAKKKIFSSVNRSLGEGLAKLLSNQILTGRYIEQQTLLTQAEVRLLRAQVDPHFLFNALNTINAVIRRDPEGARELIQHLAQFFRRNLKQKVEWVRIEEELEHVNAYLRIELARFSDRLSIHIDVDRSLFDIMIPIFTLQPLVENAIKHGTSTLLQQGKVSVIGRIKATPNGAIVELQVIDNAGNYYKRQDSDSTGLGLQIVDKRLKYHFGDEYGLDMSCIDNITTKANITFPLHGGKHA
ncbi:cell autolysis regulator LytS [Psychromonas sp. CNPT3]|uniref:sensor histidine kinase n=1 Tax=Psychromonas sp. CNPT3 TaxID=314282 RepID=UPI00006E34CA|nr:sensor histidine kinase [Psychromonas sp. CNPT3]AGH81215.1 cell autolysis regulator LytS [Psychromonas sp. CNPT3]